MMSIQHWSKELFPFIHWKQGLGASPAPPPRRLGLISTRRAWRQAR